MRPDQEALLAKTYEGRPASRGLAEAFFNRVLRPLLLEDTDEESVETARFFSLLAFHYGVKAGIQGGGLLDED